MREHKARFRRGRDGRRIIIAAPTVLPDGYLLASPLYLE
jgi:hypothetical protein